MGGKWPGPGRRGVACYALLDSGSKTELGRFPSPSFSSRSQALPGNAYGEAPPPILGAGAFANMEDFCMKMPAKSWVPRRIRNAECGSISPSPARRAAACCALLDSWRQAKRQGHPGSSIFR